MLSTLQHEPDGDDSRREGQDELQLRRRHSFPPRREEKDKLQPVTTGRWRDTTGVWFTPLSGPLGTGARGDAETDQTLANRPNPKHGDARETKTRNTTKNDLTTDNQNTSTPLQDTDFCRDFNAQISRHPRAGGNPPSPFAPRRGTRSEANAGGCPVLRYGERHMNLRHVAIMACKRHNRPKCCTTARYALQ